MAAAVPRRMPRRSRHVAHAGLVPRVPGEVGSHRRARTPRAGAPPGKPVCAGLPIHPNPPCGWSTNNRRTGARTVACSDSTIPSRPTRTVRPAGPHLGQTGPRPDRPRRPDDLPRLDDLPRPGDLPRPDDLRLGDPLPTDPPRLAVAAPGRYPPRVAPAYDRSASRDHDGCSNRPSGCGWVPRY